MSVDDELRNLAAKQHCVISRDQGYDLGATPSMLNHRRRRGEWVPMTARVLRLQGAPLTAHQRAMAAVLDAGPHAVLSHHAAAALWDLPGYLLRDLHVTRPRGVTKSRSSLAIVHESRAAVVHHATAHLGIPVTNPTRTVFDLAGVVHPLRTKRTLENAWSNRLTDGRRLAVMLDELGASGRNGIAVMRALLVDRGPDYVPPATGLEGRFRDILERAGLPPMRRQVALGGESFLGRVDFYDPEARLVVEINSDKYHSSLIDRESDEARANALRAAGFEVVTVTESQVWFSPDEIVAQIWAARRRLAARFRARSNVAGRAGSGPKRES